ncbi:MAG TPA: phosphatidylserine decarboxylase family protein [Desulfurivibrionaceae bacterium]|nr:phosphatidylserine decarboxylase family protein [Desulfurivibrionaceae bacterium]
MKRPRVPVALEGYPFIALAGFVTLVCAVLDYDFLALVGMALTTFVLYFFRDPERVTPSDEDVLVSPADGKVIVVERVFDEKHLRDHAYKVSIFMNVFNVHVNRAPYAGRVERIQYMPGMFYSADTEQGALRNEACAMTMTTKRGARFTVVQVAGLIARRIVCWADPGDSLSKGERFGLIRFGSRVDLYLPLSTQVEVTVGQKVTAGETVLGYLS